MTCLHNKGFFQKDIYPPRPDLTYCCLCGKTLADIEKEPKTSKKKRHER